MRPCIRSVILTKMLVANDLGRYKVRSDTPGRKVAPDGSITIPISHTKPTGENAATSM